MTWSIYKNDIFDDCYRYFVWHSAMYDTAVYISTFINSNIDLKFSFELVLDHPFVAFKMRYRRAQLNQKSPKQQGDEDCSWNSIIVWGICISVIVLIMLYVTFGTSLYHPPPVLVGTAQVSALDEDKKSIPVYESTINIADVGNIYYRYTEPRGQGAHSQPDILLLHGAKYGSQTWKGLGTLQIFSYWGYRTVAIDLPGYKLSKKATPPSGQVDIIRFMEAVIDKLKMTKVVIIAPSMSGTYGLPILLESNNIDLRGFVAIAPQSSNKYKKEQYQSVYILYVFIAYSQCMLM